MKTIRFVVFFVFAPWIVFGQNVENVEFSINDNVITVKYDLKNCKSNYVYDLKIKFKTDKGDYIFPKNPYGDLKEVTEGHGKTITWNVLSDNQEVKGNVSAIVEVEDSHYRKPKRNDYYSNSGGASRNDGSHGKIVGGPSNVFLSMLLPGWGTYHVEKHSGEPRKYTYLIPMVYYLGAVGAVSYYSLYQKSYSEYHLATNQFVIDEKYKTATDQYQNLQICLGFAATAWTIDVIHVLIKGGKNRRKQLNRYSLNDNNLNFYFVNINKQTQFGLTYRF